MYEQPFIYAGLKMNEIEVRELMPSEFGEWDQLVEKTQPGTPFHTSDWLEIYRDVLLRDIRIYGCFRNDDLVGGCPLFVKNYQRNPQSGIFDMQYD